jgi:T4 bacteriophage base plate protein
MRPVTPAELLNTWDQCARRTLPEKALLLLDAACTDGEPEDPALLHIGERDAKLLELREWMFGQQLLNVADCPNCSERIEWINSIGDLRYPSQNKSTSAAFSMKVENYNIQFRLPNSYDLLRTSSRDYRADPKKILAECIIDVHKNEQTCHPDELPAQVMDLLDERMALEDPQANIMMNLNCPACSHSWEAQFDIVSYLWTEIDSWAKRILQDVAVLAAAFGWSESQILNLSPQKRQHYIDIINAEFH